jgi:RNA polymerase sigma-70 factor (ECF subfamily)
MPQVESTGTQRLLDSAQAGDEQAFDRLFTRHRRYLKRFVALRLEAQLRARVDASDVVQETHLEAARRLSAYLMDRPMPFRLWLRHIAFDRLVMIRRRHVHSARRTVVREVTLPDRSSVVLGQSLLAGGPSPSEEMASREMATRVREAIKQLSQTDREILIMRNFEGLSLEEIACVLAIDASSARKRHGRALLRLRSRLVQGGLEESEL